MREAAPVSPLPEMPEGIRIPDSPAALFKPGLAPAPSGFDAVPQNPLEQMDNVMSSPGSQTEAVGQDQERQNKLAQVAQFTGAAVLKGMEVGGNVFRGAVAVGSKAVELAKKVDAHVQDVAAAGMILSEGASKFAENSGDGVAVNAKAAMQATMHMRKRTNGYKKAFKEEPKGPFKAARSAHRQEKWAA